MTKILITGAAGLIGSHLSKYLCDKNFTIIGIDDLSGGYADFVDNRVKLYKTNLINSNEVKNIFATEKPDYVYHLAAYAAEGLSPYIRNFNYQNNILSSINIINQCINYDIKKLIFTSSMAVYGFGNPPFTEDQTPQPIDPYGIAKYATEMDIKSAYEHFGLNYTVIRPHNVIGINQNIWDRYRNVIGIWIRKIINNQPISIYGDGQQQRAFSDIKYYMKPFESILYNYSNHIFNIGADREYKIIDVANMLVKIGKSYGYNPTIEHLEPRQEVKFAYCDHSKAKNLLNFNDNTDIEATIDHMFSWAVDQPQRLVKNMTYEITKNMYSFWK
jgi:UDP-glucose 4-epimerase